ncbi:MAG: ABC transporter permease, partial [Pyrinomonadaceae bacterium]
MIKALSSPFYENLKMAMATLRDNKLRSFLTIIGVVVGVITVMLISSIISGINVAVEKQVESFGTRSIFLYKYNIGFSTGRRTQEERMRKPLTMDDAEAIKGLSSIETAVPFLTVSNDFFGGKIMVTGRNGKTSSAVQMQGTMPEIEKTTTEILIEGRWFSASESDAKANVCLIGSTVADSYFPNQSPIGESLDIGGIPFRVIGVLEKKEQLFGGGGGNNDQSNVIYMPMGAALKLKPTAEDLFILAVAREGFLEKAKDQVQDLLRIRRQVDYGK